MSESVCDTNFFTVTGEGSQSPKVDRKGPVLVPEFLVLISRLIVLNL